MLGLPLRVGICKEQNIPQKVGVVLGAVKCAVVVIVVPRDGIAFVIKIVICLWLV